MTRYFMTIPEAAGLVLQSAALTQGGEVFLLDMGKPIRIVDLAERFIRAHGLEPHRDVAIQFTGIRPGEKLFEELAYDGEDMLPTPHQSIRIWRTTPPTADQINAIVARFDALRAGPGQGQPGLESGGREAILAALHDAIPEMRAPTCCPELDTRHSKLETLPAAPLAAAG